MARRIEEQSKDHPGKVGFALRRALRLHAIALGCVVAMFVTSMQAFAAEEGIRFNRDIRPILSDHCFRCHGPDAGERKGKLRLDVRESALERGAIVPGQSDKSTVLSRVRSADVDELMPPPSIHKPLDEAEKTLLERWIAAGAEYEAHWAFLPVRRPSFPPEAVEAAWAHQPVDRYVRAAQVRVGLVPAAEADRRTLLRRLSFDLTGLPPDPEALAAFERDDAVDAYERQVERLLASPHFGERMAVPWLDAVRFADTVGYHGDQNQRIFPYRDYVIDAFNRNKGFDHFTVEQIAGDLLPRRTPEQWVATGFNRLNMMTREGGAQPREYLAKYQADRVRTVSTAWLGATLACAECHDHKYDPFTTRDFYAMSAFFADIQQWGVYSDYDYTPNPDLKGWSNDHPFPPEIEVESAYLRQRLVRLREAEDRMMAIATASLRTNAASRTAFRRWRTEVGAFLEAHPDGWAQPSFERVETREGGGSEYRAALGMATLSDASIQWNATEPSHDRVVLALEPGWISAVRVELLPSEHGGGTLRGARKGATFQLSAKRLAPGMEKAEAVAFWHADAELKEPRYANGAEIDGILGGWRLSPALTRSRQMATWYVAQPWRAEVGELLTVDLPNNPAARLRISVSPLVPDRGRDVSRSAEVRRLLARGSGLWDPPVQHAFHRSVAWSADVTRDWRALDAAIREGRGGRAWTQVTVATNAVVTRVLPRGNWMDESGETVLPAVPAFLAPSAVARTGEQEGDSRRLTRLDLAHWLVSRENPLTARNLVNRLWAQFFGVGLSGRLEDLGLQGEWPTHPELLDWLAAEFMEPTVTPTGQSPQTYQPHPWDVKHVVRLLVQSATYRQSTVAQPGGRDRDPENLWLARQNPRRLEAEMVRDVALAASGLLDPSVGGPSAFPYQPPGYYSNLQFPDREYRSSPDERQYRRGIYSHWQRTFLHPMMANFDAPSREECVAARLPSNTPQQALTLLNDPSFVEAARVLAARSMAAARRDGVRLEWMSQRVLGRTLRTAERSLLMAVLESQRARYATVPDDAVRLLNVGQYRVDAELPPVEWAAWTGVARVLLNLHETITRY